jgi:hypothetical protein
MALEGKNIVCRKMPYVIGAIVCGTSTSRTRLRMPSPLDKLRRKISQSSFCKTSADRDNRFTAIALYANLANNTATPKSQTQTISIRNACQNDGAPGDAAVANRGAWASGKNVTVVAVWGKTAHSN